MSEETRMAMANEEHLGAVFDGRTSAEKAFEELRQLGLADEHLGVAMHEPGDYVFEEDIEGEVGHGVEKGIALGAPIGAIAGMTILGVVVPGVGTVGVGGLLAAGGLTGALAGTFYGGFLGLAAKDHGLEEEWEWERIPLQPGQVLIVVAGHGHPDRVAKILQRHGGHIVTKPRHVS